ncbi:hypothetical protein [Emticicia sp. BO119]|uniref:hypothetical protein n=1 Tax=Emticicia sp. BO119 TaxID=2757768 RepID=UPI0015EFECF7|nr:hypothetical protein [Emticicia sp. BO119]MBA4849833.1 hypothetical protein [Emticicia sp. BO119]
MNSSDCICYKPPFSHLNYDTVELGIDETNGRFAEVSIQTCKHCQNRWLNYFIEIEGFSSNIRWFKAIIDNALLESLTPENSLELIEKAAWYFYGGSYYGSGVSVGRGKIIV